MKTHLLLVAILPLFLAGIAGCKKQTAETDSTITDSASSGESKASSASEAAATVAHAVLPKLRIVDDPVWADVRTVMKSSRLAFKERRFDDLEKQIKELRDSKALFDSGYWKSEVFYEGFGIGDSAPDSVWQEQDKMYQEWIAAKPDSIAARIAYINFLTDYAWKARGDGYADTITLEGGQLFKERLAAAHKVLADSHDLKEKDPNWWLSGLTVALGQAWLEMGYTQLMDEALAYEPTFWSYDAQRAHSLLPRWYGSPGDWEAYADKAAARPNGLGNETYARIVIFLGPFYKNIFRESKASWPKTREGLELIVKKYPKSLANLNNAALLASLAGDQATAKEMFDRLDGACIIDIWSQPERFTHYEKWAETGVK